MKAKRAEKHEFDECYRIRREVFIDEQKVPEEIELDEHDATAMHFLVIDNNVVVATARVILKDEGKMAKIGRVAVLKSARGLGIGKILMQFIEQDSELHAVVGFILEAQTHALNFYEKLGYKSYGEEFMDAGIPHFRMKKMVDTDGKSK